MNCNNQRASARAILALLALIGLLTLAPGRRAAQSPSTEMGQSNAEPTIEQKIAELKAARKKLERDARGD